MKTPISLYSRLALITSVTLVVGYFVVYAWTTLDPVDAGPGKTLTATLMQGIVNNINDLNARVSNFGFSAGNVGIGTVTPEHKLQVSGASYIINAYNWSTVNNDSARISVRTWLSGVTYAGLELDVMNDNTYTAGQKAVIQAYRYNGGWVPLDIGIIGGNVGIGAMPPLATTYKLYVSWNTYTTWTYWSSDKRWKKNINTFTWALDKIEKLRWVTFDWRRDEYKNMNFDTGSQIWFIAQEVEKVLPELVKTDTNWYKAVSYDKFSAVLLEAVKEQQKEIEELKSKIERLENR